MHHGRSPLSLSLSVSVSVSVPVSVSVSHRPHFQSLCMYLASPPLYFFPSPFSFVPFASFSRPVLQYYSFDRFFCSHVKYFRRAFRSSILTAATAIYCKWPSNPLTLSLARLVMQPAAIIALCSAFWHFEIDRWHRILSVEYSVISCFEANHVTHPLATACAAVIFDQG